MWDVVRRGGEVWDDVGGRGIIKTLWLLRSAHSRKRERHENICPVLRSPQVERLDMIKSVCPFFCEFFRFRFLSRYVNKV